MKVDWGDKLEPLLGDFNRPSVRRDCVKCGKQVIYYAGSPDPKCLFCGEPVKKKEGFMRNITTSAGAEGVVIKKETGTSAGAQPPEVPVVKTTDIEFAPVPARPEKKSPYALHKYFKANEEQILAEYKLMTEQQVRERWGISINAWTRFKKQHDLPINKCGPMALALEKEHAQKVEEAAAEILAVAQKLGVKIAQFPVFPDFDKTWPNDVCIAWLNNYSAALGAAR